MIKGIGLSLTACVLFAAMSDYTRFDPSLDLVAAHEEAVAIIGLGEELHTEFAGPAPTAGRPGPDRETLHARFNTRYQAGY